MGGLKRSDRIGLLLVIVFDSLFYNVLVPLLPYYAGRFDMTGTLAGLLMGAFGAGTLAGIMPSVIVTSRHGARATVVIGLLLTALASLAFAAGADPLELAAARFMQGVGSGIIWTGALAWVVSVAGEGRRGTAIGDLLAAGVAGQLTGPVCGVIGAFFGPRSLFVGIAVGGALLSAWTWRMTSPPNRTRLTPPSLRRELSWLRRPAILGGVWLISLPALLSGSLSVVGPLRLSHAGMSITGIGATWLVAAIAGIAISPALGRWSDRDNRLKPLRAALLCAFGCSLAVPLVSQRWGMAVLVALAAVSYGGLWAPGMAIVSEVADRHGLELGTGSALQGLWAPGQVVGTVLVGGVIADWRGAEAAFLILAAACLATVVTTYHLKSFSSQGDHEEFPGNGAAHCP
jgi:predicted MFS family arabinose efflux permease